MRVHEPLRKLKADESDVVNILDSQDTDKMRLDSKWIDSRMYVRTFQGHIASTSIDFPNDPDNTLLAKPGFLLHRKNSKALTGILKDGLRRMGRNAIHLIPAVFNTRQSLYIQRSKTPFAVLVDADSAMLAGHRFYRTPNDVILRDGGMDAVLEPEYLKAIFDYDMSNPRDSFSRLCIIAAKSGLRPVPPHSGDLSDIPPLESPAVKMKITVSCHALGVLVIPPCRPQPHFERKIRTRFAHPKS